MSLLQPNDRRFKLIMESFDIEDKEKLALRLIEDFKIDRHGKSYCSQLETILSRELSLEEQFKVDIFDRMLNHVSGGGGGRGPGGAGSGNGGG